MKAHIQNHFSKEICSKSAAAPLHSLRLVLIVMIMMIIFQLIVKKNRVMPAQWDHIHNSSVSSSLMSVCTAVHFLKDFSCRQRLAIIRQNYKDFSLWVGVAFCWLTAPRWRCHFLLSNHPEPVLKTLVLWEMNRRIWGFPLFRGDKEVLRVCQGQFIQKPDRFELSCTGGHCKKPN